MRVLDDSARLPDAGSFGLILHQMLGADIWTGFILLEKNRTIMVNIVENHFRGSIALASRDGAFGHELSFGN
jgi:hypothetical protein